ncbi:MAG: VCBS repeat-containing protein [Acidobacteria bacterium]|nr:VCBS repeat-containing protein [Acidobacteriota bacterium]
MPEGSRTAVFGPDPPGTEADSGSVVADLDGDGLSDMFIANAGPDAPPFPRGRNLLLMRQPGGRLKDELQSRAPATLGFHHCVAAGDFNGDGATDLLVGDLIHGPHLLINDGKGFFQDLASVNLSRSSWGRFTGCVAADLNGDGKTDLAVGFMQDQNAARDLLLINDGTGQFTVENPEAFPPRGTGPNGTSGYISAADLDGNGHVDLIMLQADPSLDFTAPVMDLNNGDGTLRDASDRLPNPPSQAWQFVRPTDVNGDGSLDLVVDGWGWPPKPRLLLNRGAADFVDATELLPMDPRWSMNLLPADLDRDGLMDFLQIYEQGVRVIRGLRKIDSAAIELLAVPPAGIPAPGAAPSGDP